MHIFYAIYGVLTTEVCPVLSRHKHSLDFAVSLTRVFMKILHTGSKQTVEVSEILRFLPVSHRIDAHTARFFYPFGTSKNSLCTVFTIKYKDIRVNSQQNLVLK